MSLPISLAILVPQFNFITNNIFIGHYDKLHGTQYLATAGITGIFYLIFAAIGFGLNNGLQALISRRAGENRPEEIGKLFTQAVYIAMGVAAAGILITWFIAPLILRQLIHSAETYADAFSFLRIRIWGLPFLYIYQMRNALLVGTNNSKLLVAGTLAETIANVLFDYLFIFGKGGFPEFGFNGAAVASIIAEFTGMFVVFAVIHWKGIGRQFALFRNMQWERRNIRLILSMSSPLIFQHAISIMSWEFYFLLIEHHGSTALAISNAMRNVFGIFGVFTWAFAATSNTMVSNVIGQGRKDEVLHLVRKIMTLSVGFALVTVTLLNIFPEQVLSIYGQNNDFIAGGVPVIRVVSAAMVIMSFSVVWLNAVIGTGNSRITLLIEAISIIFYCFYVYWIMEKLFMSITIGWMSEWLYWVCLFLPSFIYMRSGRWKGKVI